MSAANAFYEMPLETIGAPFVAGSSIRLSSDKQYEIVHEGQLLTLTTGSGTKTLVDNAPRVHIVPSEMSRLGHSILLLRSGVNTTALISPTRGVVSGVAAPETVSTGEQARLPPAEQSNTIVVTGKAEVDIEPNQASIVLLISHQSLDARDAQRRVAEVRNTIVAYLIKLNDELPDSVVVTSETPGIQSVYSYPPNKPPLTVGFKATLQLAFLTKNLARLGVVIDTLVAMGTNDIYSVSFLVEDASDQRAELMASASADAFNKALRIAERVGLSITGVLQIRESDIDFTSNRWQNESFNPAASLQAAQPKRVPPTFAGRIKISAKIQLVVSTSLKTAATPSTPNLELTASNSGNPSQQTSQLTTSTNTKMALGISIDASSARPSKDSAAQWMRTWAQTARRFGLPLLWPRTLRPMTAEELVQFDVLSVEETPPSERDETWQHNRDVWAIMMRLSTIVTKEEIVFLPVLADLISAVMAHSSSSMLEDAVVRIVTGFIGREPHNQSEANVEESLKETSNKNRQSKRQRHDARDELRCELEEAVGITRGRLDGTIRAGIISGLLTWLLTEQTIVVRTTKKVVEIIDIETAVDYGTDDDLPPEPVVTRNERPNALAAIPDDVLDRLAHQFLEKQGILGAVTACGVLKETGYIERLAANTPFWLAAIEKYFGYSTNHQKNTFTDSWAVRERVASVLRPIAIGRHARAIFEELMDADRAKPVRDFYNEPQSDYDAAEMIAPEPRARLVENKLCGGRVLGAAKPTGYGFLFIAPMSRPLDVFGAFGAEPYVADYELEPSQHPANFVFARTTIELVVMAAADRLGRIQRSRQQKTTVAESAATLANAVPAHPLFMFVDCVNVRISSFSDRPIDVDVFINRDLGNAKTANIVIDIDAEVSRAKKDAVDFTPTTPTIESAEAELTRASGIVREQKTRFFYSMRTDMWFGVRGALGDRFRGSGETRGPITILPYGVDDGRASLLLDELGVATEPRMPRVIFDDYAAYALVNTTIAVGSVPQDMSTHVLAMTRTFVDSTKSATTSIDVPEKADVASPSVAVNIGPSTIAARPNAAAVMILAQKRDAATRGRIKTYQLTTAGENWHESAWSLDFGMKLPDSMVVATFGGPTADGQQITSSTGRTWLVSQDREKQQVLFYKNHGLCAVKTSCDDTAPVFHFSVTYSATEKDAVGQWRSLFRYQLESSDQLKANFFQDGEQTRPVGAVHTLGRSPLAFRDNTPETKGSLLAAFGHRHQRNQVVEDDPLEETQHNLVSAFVESTDAGRKALVYGATFDTTVLNARVIKTAGSTNVLAAENVSFASRLRALSIVGNSFIGLVPHVGPRMIVSHPFGPTLDQLGKLSPSELSYRLREQLLVDPRYALWLGNFNVWPTDLGVPTAGRAAFVVVPLDLGAYRPRHATTYTRAVNTRYDITQSIIGTN